LAARVKTGGDALSSAFERRAVFPSIYHHAAAGERSGNLQEVLERYVSFQRHLAHFPKADRIVDLSRRCADLVPG